MARRTLGKALPRGFAASPASAVLACGALLLATPAGALAARAPDRNERRAITRAALITDGGPSLLIRASDIRVSTAGPWATAQVATYQARSPKQPEQVAVESFYRSHGRWLDTNNANTPERNPPAAVRADLGLQPNVSSSGGGLSPLVIAAIALGGVLVLSIVVAALRPERGPQTVTIRGPDPRPDPQPSGPGSRPRVCPRCSGAREIRCPEYPCQGNGGWYADDPNHSGRPVWRVCQRCHGRGKITCPDCPR
ncbi:MAG TPA: hypothetical protein VJ741_18620 [Solirubrobacteraceae bacterium]|nr:hypothetical protein [Solirubrobacteraceae bacterium]